MLDTKALAEAAAAVVREHVERATAPLIQRIADLEARAAAVPEKGERGEAGRDGADGKDADPTLIMTVVEEAVARAVAALPAPEKGEKGEAGERGEKGADGQDGRDGKDGVGLAGMMIDRGGEAIATLTDGKMIKLGPVVGRDGRDGERGADGRDGRDGKDLDDVKIVQDGAKLELSFQIGEKRSIYEVELPAGPAGENGKDAYSGEARGLHDPTASYRKMDVVSFNGCEWRAKQDDPGEIPGPGWMLSASKGKRGDRGERGLAGQDGLSPVAMYRRGGELVTTLSDGAELVADLSDLEKDNG